MASSSVNWNISRNFFFPLIRFSFGNFKPPTASSWFCLKHALCCNFWSLDFFFQLIFWRSKQYKILGYVEFSILNWAWLWDLTPFKVTKLLQCFQGAAQAGALCLRLSGAPSPVFLPRENTIWCLFFLSFFLRARDLSHSLVSAWVPESFTSACRKWLGKKVTFTF